MVQGGRYICKRSCRQQIDNLSGRSLSRSFLFLWQRNVDRPKQRAVFIVKANGKSCIDLGYWYFKTQNGAKISSLFLLGRMRPCYHSRLVYKTSVRQINCLLDGWTTMEAIAKVLIPTRLREDTSLLKLPSNATIGLSNSSLCEFSQKGLEEKPLREQFCSWVIIDIEDR